MKYLTGFFLSLLFTGNLFASMLCDSSCKLSITFPDGGSIEAVESITVTFGDGGFVDDGIVVTGYSAGDTLSLSVGESLVFHDEAAIELGNGGNIDYSDILIISNGVMELSAVGASEKILIYDITLLGSVSLNISSNVDVVENGSFHIFSSPVTISAASVFTNNGEVSGLFEFESATLALDSKTYDLEGVILIEVEGPLTITSNEVEITTGSSLTVGAAGEVSATDNLEPAAASGEAGVINILSLFSISILMLTLRFQRISNKKYI